MNVYSERQGKGMNLLRGILQSRMKLLLLNSKMAGYFNLPSNFYQKSSVSDKHINTLCYIWRCIICGHDVSKPNNLKQKPDIETKYFHKIKRKILRK